ncbi:hypothetical protein AmaxDRAFT_2097 [Limnospira maxima CS-328]|uniref:Uncharacterized protein n=1 Tax=Limnospira maxima CS-328 TaxID=513049 RepID=B5W005_LIMMA|nr:hypothetical protein AmaxDRAFT_2097 [Limnospira maxima CS-328]
MFDYVPFHQLSLVGGLAILFQRSPDCYTLMLIILYQETGSQTLHFRATS